MCSWGDQVPCLWDDGKWNSGDTFAWYTFSTSFRASTNTRKAWNFFLLSYCTQFQDHLVGRHYPGTFVWKLLLILQSKYSLFVCVTPDQFITGIDFFIFFLISPTFIVFLFPSNRGLEFLHEHCNPPIIHGDLKSSSILLDSEFNMKVLIIKFSYICLNLSRRRMKNVLFF